MRLLFSMIPIAAGILVAQTADMDDAEMSRRDRMLRDIERAGQQTHKLADPARSLSAEAADDPTISAGRQMHDAPGAARKAAEKAEKLSKKGRHDDAIEQLKRALEIDPQFYEAENNLALEYEAIGKNDDAERTLQHLTESSPDHVIAFNNLATLLCRQKRYGEAEVVARRALKAHPYSFKANLLFGTALVQQGKWVPEARAKLEYAQVKHPEAKTLLDQWPAQR